MTDVADRTVEELIGRFLDHTRNAMEAEHVPSATVDRVVNRLLYGNPHGHRPHPDATMAFSSALIPAPDCQCGHTAIWHRWDGGTPDQPDSYGPCEITGPQPSDGCTCASYRPVTPPEDHRA